MERIQRELRRLAASYLRRERIGHTLQPTAVVNEAYIPLVSERPALTVASRLTIRAGGCHD
jgi:hypothetical protein